MRLVGILTVAIYFLVLWIAVRAINSTIVVTLLAYLASAAFNYLMQRNFTFQARLANRTSLRRYAVMHASAMVANSAAMYLLVDVAGTNLYLAQLIVTAIIAILSFLLSRFWVFADR